MHRPTFLPNRRSATAQPTAQLTAQPVTFSDMRNWILTAHVVLKVDDGGSNSSDGGGEGDVFSDGMEMGTEKRGEHGGGGSGGGGGSASGVVLKCDGEEQIWSEGCPPTVIDTTFRHETWNKGTLITHYEY